MRNFYTKIVAIAFVAAYTLIPSLTFAWDKNVTATVDVSGANNNLTVTPSGGGYFGWDGIAEFPQLNESGPATYGWSGSTGGYYFINASPDDYTCALAAENVFTDCDLPTSLSAWKGVATQSGDSENWEWTLSGQFASTGGLGDIIASSNSTMAASLGGLNTGEAGGFMKTWLLYIIGSGFGVLVYLLPYIIGLAIFAAIIYFAYTGFRFFRN